MSWYIIVLLISLYFLSFVFSLIKIYSKKKTAEFILAIVPLVVALSGLYGQYITAHKMELKSNRDSLSHIKEVLDIKHENKSLKQKLEIIEEENHSLIQSLSSFRELFKITTKRQDTIFNFITGGENLPLINAVQYGNTPNVVDVLIENYGTVPLRDVNYIIRNSDGREVIDQRLPSLSYQRIVDVYKFLVPRNIDSCRLDCTVIWPGIKLRTYTAHIFVYQKIPGLITIKISYVLLGERPFDPYRSKSLFFPKTRTKRKV